MDKIIIAATLDPEEFLPLLKQMERRFACHGYVNATNVLT